ncbi:MAG: topoisomerase [Gammaproteobacteria bacterium]|jgi:DNA topoisomerase-1|nr:topoisomerase [Gammaproteobacteria bacterium]
MTLKCSTAVPNLTGVAAEAAQMAVEAGLIYVSDAEPGIRRLRAGKGFRYLTPENRRLAAAKELKRIASLAIPPAYRDVWISVKARGHLQATGRDARGRKQYRYHPDWRQVRDSAKFDRMVAFGEGLPKLRRKLKRDLGLPGLPREKVLAVVVSILDATRVRIGNSEYARDNKSFGLTTLRNRHVSFIRDGRAILNFRGKGGVQHEVHINDKRIAQIVRRCQEIPGQHLFQYVSDEGQRCPIDSGQVNDYLREAMGDDFTAKDFRTWGATLHAITLLAHTPLPAAPSERAFRREITGVVKQVAAKLRNTPAVCRKSYINPAVFDAWRGGLIHKVFNGNLSLAAPRRAETLVLAFLRHEAKSLDVN